MNRSTLPRLPRIVPTVLAASAFFTQSAWSQEQTVIVTGSVIERRLAEAPFAISVVDAEQISGSGPMVNLSESMSVK